MDPADLERWLDGELRKLPEPRAPETLAASVLQAVSVEHADAAAPPWFAWPRAQQWLSVAALLVVLAAAAGLWLAVRAPILAALSAPVTSVASRVESFAQPAYDMTLAARVIWRVLEPFAIGLFTLVAIMVAACAAIGAALRHLAAGGTSA